MNAILDCFSAHYSDARGRFLAAAAGAGARLAHYHNPVTGPQGELLATDVARLGPSDAPRKLLLVSGTHGTEGFCGAGVQVALLRSVADGGLPPATGLVLVHAINPYGFAWLRRVTEDNVDLNRNFVDHDRGRYPANAGYDELAAALLPADWTEASRAASQKVIDRFIETHGPFGFQAAVSGGQYDHPDGLFYGGRRATWSRRTFEEIVAAHIAGARTAVLIDVHTGLGPYGYGEPIVLHPPNSDGYRRARKWFGEDVTTPFGGPAYAAASASPAITGHLGAGCVTVAPGTAWTSLVLEFGTQPFTDVIDALRADAWLHARGDLKSHLARDIKATMRATFYGDEPRWKNKVWKRSFSFIERALAGLTDS